MTEAAGKTNSAGMKRIAVLSAAGMLVALFFFLDIDRFLTLEYLKEARHGFRQLYEAQPAIVAGTYAFVYIIATAFSLPGAVVLTLAGGALFGFTTGLLLVSFASTIGATAACAVARFLLRDWVQDRFGDRLAPVNAGIEHEGAFYLFTLRLIPVIPFFVINLVMGLTRMPLRTYFLVSQIGMLPGTAVYVNAGRELGRIDSLKGIASPGLIASFVLLGLFPITMKKLMESWKRRRGQIQPGEKENG